MGGPSGTSPWALSEVRSQGWNLVGCLYTSDRPKRILVYWPPILESLPVRVGILFFSNVDILDSCGPYEVFLTATRLAERDGARPPFQVVTAGGLSSGIATALHLVERIAGRDLAERTANQLDYAWDPDGRRYGSQGRRT